MASVGGILVLVKSTWSLIAHGVMEALWALKVKVKNDHRSEFSNLSNSPFHG